MVTAGVMGTALPCTGSHEGTGTVVARGSFVEGFSKGDRVMAGLPRNRCGHCPDCLGPEGYRQYCPNLEGYVGVTLDGAFAEYVVVDARESCIIPDEVSFETAAPLACAGCTIWRGILQTGLKKGEAVGIVGAGGGLGHLGCRFAKALGLVVVGVDARDEGLRLAKEAGADVVVDARMEKEKVVEDVRKATNGMGVDATITVSDGPTAAALACAITRMHGTMVQIAQVSSRPLARRAGSLTPRTAERGLRPLSRARVPGHQNQRLLDQHAARGSAHATNGCRSQDQRQDQLLLRAGGTPKADRSRPHRKDGGQRRHRYRRGGTEATQGGKSWNNLELRFDDDVPPCASSCTIDTNRSHGRQK